MNVNVGALFFLLKLIYIKAVLLVVMYKTEKGLDKLLQYAIMVMY